MQHLYYELSVLEKSVKFKNLSAAAMHVGLSQPQLSRIIHKIEQELNLVLLDRSAKRKSGWTLSAQRLAKIFEGSSKKLIDEISTLSTSIKTKELRIGTLEGMSSFAMQVSQSCFDKVGVKQITLDIYDLNDLEAYFLSNDLDLIFTSHLPGRQKFTHLFEVGYQYFQKVETNKKYLVLSGFEFQKMDKKKMQGYNSVLISNSLAIKKNWLNQKGGTGNIPNETIKGKIQKDAKPVYLIGTETLNHELWEEIIKVLSL